MRRESKNVRGCRASFRHVTNTLGITMEPLPVAQFSELRKQITDRTLVGAFRTGWQADYPSMNNFLGAVYQTGAGSNDSDYSSQEFDGFLAQAAAATDQTAALGFYTAVDRKSVV